MAEGEHWVAWAFTVWEGGCLIQRDMSWSLTRLTLCQCLLQCPLCYGPMTESNSAQLSRLVGGKAPVSLINQWVK